MRNYTPPANPSPGALRSRKWRREHYDRKKELDRASEIKTRIRYPGFSTDPRPVRVEYPDVGKPDFYSLAEYHRRKNEFDPDARVYICGVQQAVQIELMPEAVC